MIDERYILIHKNDKDYAYMGECIEKRDQITKNSLSDWKHLLLKTFQHPIFFKVNSMKKYFQYPQKKKLK